MASDSHASARRTDVAVIGMAGRFPGAADVAALWRMLARGEEPLTILSDDDLRAVGVSEAAIANPAYVKCEHVLDGIDLFDAAFFGFSASEAAIIDPQSRMFLECSWEALESAGYDPDASDGLVGVYASSSTNSYLIYNLLPNRNRWDLEELHPGIHKDFLSTIVSYKLNLTGPSLVVQSFCSSSLAAIHVACQSLIHEECDLAISGGASVKVPQRLGYLHRPGGIMSPDGRCRAFDARAEGTPFSSGVAVVVLKRLADALADGDHIRAVIKGSAVNNDGAGKVSFMAPSLEGQAGALTEALSFAGVSPDSISYVEAHGTGTAIGDPVELAALTRVFRKTTARTGYCAIGSLKTNLGHLDAAAGAAGLIKATLALERRAIPPTLHYERPNPESDLAASPFRVNTTLTPWETAGGPRRAGVNSLGGGGTNVHVVLEEAPPAEPSDPARPFEVLVISARTEAALDAATLRLAAHLERDPTANLGDVAYTLQIGRRAFNWRRFVVATSATDAAAQLAARSPDRVPTRHLERRRTPVTFRFADGDLAHGGLGADLYRAYPAHRAQVERCAEILRPRLDLDLRELFRSGEVDPASLQRRLGDGAVSRAALFASQIAMARLWMAWGVQPSTAIGIGVGDCVAAHLAGQLTLEAALARAVDEPLDPRAGGAAWRIPESPEATGEPVLLDLGPRGAKAPGGPEPGDAVLGAALGNLWLAGVEIDWLAVHAPARRRRAPLPTYPFQRRRYWIDPPAPARGDAERRPEPAAVPGAAPTAVAPLLARPELPTPYVAPTSPTERALVDIWQEVLGVGGIGVDDDFYAIGGDSLIAIRIASRAAERFGAEVPIENILELTTVALLAAWIDEDQRRRAATAPAADREDFEI